MLHAAILYHKKGDSSMCAIVQASSSVVALSFFCLYGACREFLKTGMSREKTDNLGCEMFKYLCSRYFERFSLFLCVSLGGVTWCGVSVDCGDAGSCGAGSR